MELNNILLTRGGGIATLTVNRPKSLNALNRETLVELLRCCRELSEDQEVRVVIITGAGERPLSPGRIFRQCSHSMLWPPGNSAVLVTR